MSTYIYIYICKYIYILILVCVVLSVLLVSLVLLVHSGNQDISVIIIRGGLSEKPVWASLCELRLHYKILDYTILYRII